MDTRRHHLLDDREGWLTMWYSGLGRPLTEASNVYALANSDGSILMPSKSPVGFNGLIEENGSYGSRRRAEGRAYDGGDWTVSQPFA
jgi:hypothetical protein